MRMLEEYPLHIAAVTCDARVCVHALVLRGAAGHQSSVSGKSLLITFAGVHGTVFLTG